MVEANLAVIHLMVWVTTKSFGWRHCFWKFLKFAEHITVWRLGWDCVC